MPRSAIETNRGQTTTDFRTIKPFISQMLAGQTDRRFNIVNYGARSTVAFDSTFAVRNAINAAVAAGGGLVYVPNSANGFIIRPSDEPAEQSFILTLPPGVGLIGDGYNSVLRFKVDDYDIADGHYAGIRLEGYNSVSNIRLDGNRDNITLAGEKIFYGYHAAVDAHHIVFKDLWIHGIPSNGAGKESFGILLASGVHTVLMDNVEAFDNDGSGISVNGNNPLPEIEGDNGSGNVHVRNCRCYNNDWMGITCYATHGIFIEACHCYNNARFGMNVEWCKRLKIDGCEFAYSTLGNFRVMGLSHVVASDCYIHGSAATNEISVSAGGFHRTIVEEGSYTTSANIQRWLLGVPFPATATTGETLGRYLLDVYPSDGVASALATRPIAMPEYVELNNCLVVRGIDELGSGSVQHLQVRSVEAYIDPTDGQLTLYGDRSYSDVVLNCPDADEWQITGWIYHRDDTEVRANVPGLRFPLHRNGTRVPLNPLSMWQAGGTITTSQAYTGVDNLSLGAWTLISSTEESDFGAVAADSKYYPLEGGTAGQGLRSYHVRCRAKVTQPTGATIDDPDLWAINIARKAGAGGLSLNLLFGSMEDDGVWVETEGIARCGPGAFNVVAFYGERSATASTPGRIDIDYITVTDLSSRQGQSDSGRHGGGRTFYADEMPTIGTYHKLDIIWITRLWDGTEQGKICFEGGTYGTLTGVTGDTTASDAAVPSTGGLYANEYITIEGASRLDGAGAVFRTILVDAVDIITLDSAADATLSDAVIQYSEPVWKDIFPVGGDRFISNLPVGSYTALVVPRDDSNRGYDEDSFVLRGIPRLRLRRTAE